MPQDGFLQVFGLDFTSAPGPRKPITCAVGQYQDGILALTTCRYLTDFGQFERFLGEDGPWMAGMDFPFGQPRKLIENLDWPRDWSTYVAQVGRLESVEQFAQLLKRYQADRPTGDKQHLRRIDVLARSRSPMMMVRVPVGRMFFQGAPRLLASKANLPPHRPTSDCRTVVETYPAAVARRWIGSASYKQDDRRKQTDAHRQARRQILEGIKSECPRFYGFELVLDDGLADDCLADPTADTLDAVLCALPATWSWNQRTRHWGIPADCDPVEGWIVDPQFGETSDPVDTPKTTMPR